MTEGHTQSLRERGYRLTPQRLAIMRILHDGGKHMSPVEIYQQARIEMPGLTEATVYRNLNFLSGQGLILEAHVGSGQLVYEVAHREHDHVICRKCGQTEEIDHVSLEALYRELHAHTGYQIDSLHVTFFGLCPNCR